MNDPVFKPALKNNKYSISVKDHVLTYFRLYYIFITEERTG